MSQTASPATEPKLAPTGSSNGQPTAPPTGAEYLESLRDGRAIYFDGALVDDVTTHPAFSTAAHTFARMYDSLHDPALQDKLTFVTERGTRSHKFYKLPKTPQDLYEARDAIAEWAKLNFGILSRGPDYKAALVGTIAGDADNYGEYAPNVRRWYEQITDGVQFVNLSLVNPAGDKTKSLSEQRESIIHVVKERDDGIVVRGARMVSTGAAFSHVTYVSQFISGSQLGSDDKDFALGFFVPFDAPGIKFIGRYSYEYLAKRTGSPFDYPLSSRFDESDMSIVFDDVFIPWEDVTVYRDPDIVNSLMPHGFAQRFAFHAATRTAVKLDFMCGLLLKATDANQISTFRGVQAELGEVIGWRNSMWAMASAMAGEPDPGPGGYVLPNVRFAVAWRNAYGPLFGAIKEKFQKLLAGSLIQIPSSAEDLKNPASRRFIDQYWKGANISAEERIKLIRLIWDVCSTEFAGRTELHERNFSGSHEGNRLETLRVAQMLGDADAMTGMVDRCLSEYDLDGWTSDTWPTWERV
jgi:4-hydroxyphenylacetate 3-monooxygenase